MEIVERVGGIDFLVPNDLVIEILLRLPVESLLRFKTVCKYWYDVINGCDFVDNHFDHHSNHSRLLVYHDIPFPIQYFGVGEATDQALSIFPDETLAGEHPSHHYLDYPCMPNRAKEVIGPVKGVFLLRLFEDELLQGCTAVLLNPATREFRPLVVPYSDWDSYHSYLFQMFGFGFDPLNRDFKVVSLWCWDESRISIPSSGRPRVVVYSLANDSWKYLDLDLEHDPLNKRNRKKVCSNSGTTHINGTCYWMLQDCKLEIFYLLSFDLTSEVLREIKVPEYDSFTVRHPKLVLYNDSVAMFFYHPYIWSGVLYSENIDLMVMNKEGCWTKDLTVDVSHLQMEWSPLGFWKNKSLFFHAGDDMQLVLFDHSTHEIKELGIHKRYFDSCPFVYKESLVSLKGGTLQHEDIFSFRTHSLEGEENN